MLAMSPYQSRNNIEGRPMNSHNISALSCLFFGVLFTVYTLVGEALAYSPLTILLLVKSYQVMEQQAENAKTDKLLKSIIFFIMAVVFERFIAIYDMTLLSYFTSLYLIATASYLVINIDNILSDKVSDESIIAIVTSCLVLLFHYYYPQDIVILSLTINLLMAVSLYFTFTNQLLRKVSLTSSQIFIIEQSQWLLFIYSLFRLISKVFDIDFQFSLIFYIGALALFLVITYPIIKQYKQLHTSIKMASISACILITTLGVECCYYATT